MIILSNKLNLRELIKEKSEKLTESEYKNFCDTFNDKYDYTKITDMSGLFFDLDNLKTIPLLNMENIVDAHSMFHNCYKLEELQLINTNNITDMTSMFFCCKELETIPKINTSNVVSMECMFLGCLKIKYIPHLDTSKVTNMECMFDDCILLEKIPQLDYSSLENANKMFLNCKSLTNRIILPNYKGEAISKNQMYDGCTNLKTKKQLLEEKMNKIKIEKIEKNIKEINNKLQKNNCGNLSL